MSLTGLLHALLHDYGDPALRSAAADARRGAVTTFDLTAPPALRPFVVGAMADRISGGSRPVLAVTATSREAEDLVDALRCLLPPDSVAEYPSWETLPHERLSPRSDTVGRRLAVLRRLVHRRGTATPARVRSRSSSHRSAAFPDCGRAGVPSIIAIPLSRLTGSRRRVGGVNSATGGWNPGPRDQRLRVDTSIRDR